MSSAIGRSSPRNQSPSGTPKPCLGRRRISGGSMASTAFLKTILLLPPRRLKSSGSDATYSIRSRSSNGLRASSPWAIVMRSIFGSRSSSRYVRAFR